MRNDSQEGSDHENADADQDISTLAVHVGWLVAVLVGGIPASFASTDGGNPRPEVLLREAARGADRLQIMADHWGKSGALVTVANRGEIAAFLGMVVTRPDSAPRPRRTFGSARCLKRF